MCIYTNYFGSLAQLVEQESFKFEVTGSNPVRSTKQCPSPVSTSSQGICRTGRLIDVNRQVGPCNVLITVYRFAAAGRLTSRRSSKVTVNLSLCNRSVKTDWKHARAPYYDPVTLSKLCSWNAAICELFTTGFAASEARVRWVTIFARVAQLAEALDRESRCCGFDSHPGHQFMNVWTKW